MVRAGFRGFRRGRGRGGRGRGGRVLKKIERRWRAGVDRPDPPIARMPPRLALGQSYYTRVIRCEYGFSVKCTGTENAQDFKYVSCFYIKDLVGDEDSSLKNLKALFNEVRFNYVNVWIMPNCSMSASGNYCGRVYDALTDCPGDVAFKVLINADATEVRSVRQPIALKWRRTEASEMDFINISDSGAIFSLMCAGTGFVDGNNSKVFGAQIVTDASVTLRAMKIPVVTAANRFAHRLQDLPPDVLRAAFEKAFGIEQPRVPGPSELQAVLNEPGTSASIAPSGLLEFRARALNSLANISTYCGGTNKSAFDVVVVVNKILGKMKSDERNQLLAELPDAIRTQLELSDWEVTNME